MYGPGDLFDRHYRIHSLLALGGAGVTYLAREVGVDGEEIGPRLALKVLFASRDEGAYLRRLATEAQILQELDHPNIVQCLGFVHRAGHSPYLVTRYEAGGSLLDHIKRVGSMSVRRACQVGRQVCWALDKAHAMGVVHRDLKPENVLLARIVGPDEDPVVRVADFGIAKVQGALGGMTRVGAFVGTPLYAAPEQFIGASPTPAADVYAVGALLYFCTMVMPVTEFADRLDPADSYELLQQNLPPVVDRPHDDADDVRRLNEVLAVCMAAEPRARCDIEELDELLGAIVAGRDPGTDSLTSVEAPLVASPTLSVDPETQDELLKELSPAVDASEGGAAGDHPDRLPTPVPRRSELEAAAAADAAAADAAAADLGMRTLDDEPEDTVPMVAARPAPKRRRRSCLLPVVGGLGVGGVVLLALAWGLALRFAPGALPAALQLSPHTLDPADTRDAVVVGSISDALSARLPSVAAQCGANGGTFTAVLTVAPSGRVAAITVQDLSRGLDGACIGQALVADPLPSPGWRAVRVGVALQLPGE